MPSYDTATVAFVAGAPNKWVDNLSSHYALPGVDSVGRGIRREFSLEAVILITAIRSLVDELGTPLVRAVELADQSRLSPDGSVSLAGGLQLQVDQERIAQTVRRRLLEAAESVPRVRRGRPPRPRTPHTPP